MNEHGLETPARGRRGEAGDAVQKRPDTATADSPTPTCFWRGFQPRGGFEYPTAERRVPLRVLLPQHFTRV